MHTLKVQTYVNKTLAQTVGVRLSRGNSLIVDASKKVVCDGKEKTNRQTKSIRIGFDGSLTDEANIEKFQIALELALRIKAKLSENVATVGFEKTFVETDITLQGIWDKYSENLFNGVLKDNKRYTEQNIEQVTQYFDDCVEFFGRDKKLNSFTIEEIDDFKQWVQEKILSRKMNSLGTVSNGAVNKRLGCLRTILRLALRYKYLQKSNLIDQTKNNFGIQDLPRIVAKEKPAMTIAEQLHLLKTIRQSGNNYFADMIEIAFGTGMRHSTELNMFTVNNVNWKDKTIMFWRNKTKSWSKPLPLSKNCFDILSNHRESAMQNGGKFFPMSKAKLRHYWHKYRELAGFDKTFTPYITRGSYITYLVEQGVDPKTVQMYAGHTCIETTLTFYAKPTKQGLEKVRQLLDAPLTKQIEV